MYNVKIEEFCKRFGLGKIIEWELFPNGMANKTYWVETEQGKYVIKAINPTKVNSEKKLKRLIVSENIAEIANKQGVPSILVKRIEGEIINEFMDQHYIVFDFFDGDVIHLNKLTTLHCFKAGELLGRLHSAKFKELNKKDIPKCSYGKKSEDRIDWEYYFDEIAKTSPDWLKLLEENLPLLNRMFDLSHEIHTNFTPGDKVVSHGDVSNLNVMWKGNTPYFLDWETGGYIDATYECLYAAIRFASQKDLQNSRKRILNMEKLYAFFEGYTEKRILKVDDLNVALYMIYYKRISILQNYFRKYLSATDESHRKHSERVIIPFLELLKSIEGLELQMGEIKERIRYFQMKKELKDNFVNDIKEVVKKEILEELAREKKLKFSLRSLFK